MKAGKLEKNKLYVMDCFEFLKLIPDGYIDLIVIDPPYNMGKGNWDKFKTEKEFFNFTYSYLDELIKKLKNTGSLYIFNTPYNCAFILRYLVRQGMIFKNWITWDKRDGLSGTKKKYVNAQEVVLFFTKSNEYVFNADDIRVPYDSIERIEHAKRKGIIKNGKRWFPNPKGKLCTDVWHFSSERHKNKINGKVIKMGHPTPKPLDLVERIIKASSNKGDLVLDCFMGIGTTAIASKKLGRNFIGCDINPEFIKIAEERLKEVRVNILF